MSADIHTTVTFEIIVPVGRFGEDADIAWLRREANTSAQTAAQHLITAAGRDHLTRQYKLKIKSFGEPAISLCKLDDDERQKAEAEDMIPVKSHDL